MKSQPSATRYNRSMTVSRRIELVRGSLPSQAAALILDARRAMGWTQDELASRAGTSQTRIWRLENGDPSAFDPSVFDDILAALGVRLTLNANARHLDDRARQRDAVHARLLETIAAALERHRWTVLTEVPVGGDPPRGWIDLVAHREIDEAMTVAEVKTLINDAGDVQRQLTYYTHEAPWAARRVGWRPRVIVPVLAVLDTESVAAVLRDNAAQLRRAFPGDPRQLVQWLASPTEPPPMGATILAADLVRRRSLGLRPAAVHGRRRRSAYANYADAATSLRRRRHRSGSS